jgi:hypothetical protein
MRFRWILVAAALAVVAVLLWIVVDGRLVQQAAQLVASGGERVLREPMRPPAPGPRVLIIALDGVGEEALLRALREGAMPHAGAALGLRPDGSFAHAWAGSGVLSVLPSTTLAAWAALFTGEPPARNGVPGNEWFAREEPRFYAPAPVSVEGVEDAAASFTEDLVGGALRVPTLYEQADVRAFVALSHIHRGADLLIYPDPSVLADVVRAAVQGLGGDADGAQRELYTALDREAVEGLLESMRTHGVPALATLYLPGVDLYTHQAENPLEEKQRYLADVIDPLVGAVLLAYRNAGVLDDTFVVLVSDHGHTPVLHDERHALATDAERDPPALLAAAGFRVRPFELELDDAAADYQAVLAYQGAMAYVYLADRSSCPRQGDVCDWHRAPRLHEDVLVVARAFDRANRFGEGVPDLRGTLDLILARPPRPPGAEALPFDVWDGDGLVPLADYLARNPRPELLDFEARMRGLAEGPYGHRAGDVLLMTRSGAERPLHDRYYFSSLYRSWHGSATAQDSRIPLLVAHRGMDAAALRRLVEGAVGAAPSQLDVTRLVLALLRSR